MRLVIILNLFFIVVHPCVDFWEKWKDSSLLTSADRRYTSKKQSTAVISENILTVTCGNEALDYDLIPCLDVKNIQIITFEECYMSNFDVGRFASGNNITEVNIQYDYYWKRTKNFESAHFINMPELKSLIISGLRTSALLNLVFNNVPSMAYLNIRNFNSTSLLHRPFQQLTNLSELHIAEGSLAFLSEDIFYGLRNLRKLVVYRTPIQRIPRDVIRHLLRLEYLKFAYNNLNNLPSDLLEGLFNLKEIIIDSNRGLTKLPQGFWLKAHTFTSFSVTRCSLSVIEENIFQDVINLSDVTLSGNEIQTLPSKLFKNNKNLEKFICSNNKLTSLSRDIFNGLLKLREINLGSNLLRSISEDVFRNLPSLEHLDLSANKIMFLSKDFFFSLNNLRRLRLSRNNLEKYSGENFFRMGKNLQYLHILNAGLTEWPRINWTAQNLTFAEFDGNRFYTVNLPIYTPNPLKIDLLNCEIKTIYIDDRKYGLNTPTYNLRGNQLTCDHKLQQFVFAIKSNLEISLKMFPDLNNMKCSGEERKVIDSRPFFAIANHCPVNCECYRDEEDVKLNCAGNGISEVPEVLIENATIVDLSNNNISKVSGIDWVTWKNVTRLYLSNNSLIDFSVYPLPPRLIYLSLDGNRLTALPQELFKLIDYSSNFRIFLSNNHWSCECGAGFSKDWLLRNKKKIIDFHLVSCQINSTSVLFSEILSRDDCRVPSVNNLTLENASSDEESSDNVHPVNKREIVIIVLSLVLLGCLMVIVFFTYLYRKKMVAEKPKSARDKVIYSNIYDDIH